MQQATTDITPKEHHKIINAMVNLSDGRLPNIKFPSIRTMPEEVLARDKFLLVVHPGYGRSGYIKKDVEETFVEHRNILRKAMSSNLSELKCMYEMGTRKRELYEARFLPWAIFWDSGELDQIANDIRIIRLIRKAQKENIPVFLHVPSQYEKTTGCFVARDNPKLEFVRFVNTLGIPRNNGIYAVGSERGGGVLPMHDYFQKLGYWPLFYYEGQSLMPFSNEKRGELFIAGGYAGKCLTDAYRVYSRFVKRSTILRDYSATYFGVPPPEVTKKIKRTPPAQKLLDAAMEDPIAEGEVLTLIESLCPSIRAKDDSRFRIEGLSGNHRKYYPVEIKESAEVGLDS